MAEGDPHVYNNAYEQLMLGAFNLGTDTIKVMLVAGHSVDIDNDAAYADVSGDEESGTGYTAGGETLASQSVAQDNTNDRGVFDGDNVTWTGLDVGTPSHAIIYSVTASNYLIGGWELGRASNGGNYTLEFHTTNGIMTMAAS